MFTLGDIDLMDVDALSDKTQGNPVELPEKVEGRVVHIDGDYLAYIVAADRVGQDETTLPQAIKHLHEFVEQLEDYAGATHHVIHLTSGDKGGRADQAQLKPYQLNRQDKEVPLLLGDVKAHIAEKENSYVCTTGEADDSMAMFAYIARITGESHKCVIASQDKDLRMVQGLHIDWMSGELYEVDALGKLEMRVRMGKDDKKIKKLWGTGALWFFAQMLMGDTADNISGLPKMVGTILNKIQPTAAVTKAIETLKDGKATEKQVQKATKTLLERKGKACGQVVAYEFLKDCKTRYDAYYKVMDAYRLYGEQYGFVNYEGKEITALEAFESEARLLYMRHNIHKDDFKQFLAEIMEEHERHGNRAET